MKTKIILCVLTLLMWSMNTFAQANSIPQSTTNSQYGNLLFQGIYTLTGLCRNGLSISGTGAPVLQYISVYERAMEAEGFKTMPYRGNATIYGDTGRKYGLNDELFFLVTNNGLVRLVSVFSVTMPIVGTVEDVNMAYYDVGDTRNLYAGNSFGGINNNTNGYNGGSINNGGTYNTQPRQRNCNHCHGTGLCPNCNGTGWVVNPYGNVKGQYPCVNCNPNGDKVTNYGKGKCPLCGGLGKR